MNARTSRAPLDRGLYSKRSTTMSTWTCMPAGRKNRHSVPRAAKPKRRSFLIDERVFRRAKKILGVSTDAEVVRLSVERIAEMEQFWQFMEKTRGTLPRGSIERA